MDMNATGIAGALGLPTKSNIMMDVGTRDDIPATMEPSGEPMQISEGEYVISVPAIIALGEGDYDTGLHLLDQIHEELKAKGKEMAGSVGIGAV